MQLIYMHIENCSVTLIKNMTKWLKRTIPMYNVKSRVQAQLVKSNSFFLWRWLSAWLFLLWADGPMRNLERSCRFKRVLKMLIFFRLYNFGGKCIPDFYSANREETSIWGLFLIIVIESLKGWPRRFVEVENVKKLLRVMMMLLWIML